MTQPVYKLIELVGASSNSIEEAIENALDKCAETISHLDWFKVVETRGRINEQHAITYQVVLKVGFRLET